MCDGIDDNADVYIRHDEAPAACLAYTFRYGYTLPPWLGAGRMHAAYPSTNPDSRAAVMTAIGKGTLRPARRRHAPDVA